MSRSKGHATHAIDDFPKGGLPQFLELFAVILYAPKDFKLNESHYLETYGLKLKLRAL